MTAIRAWLIGRKTYLLSGALCLATLGLVMAGRLTPHAALVLLLIAAFGFPATFKAALARHQEEELELLEEIAVTGAAVAARNIPGALAAGEHVIQDGSNLVQECQAEAQTT